VRFGLALEAARLGEAMHQLGRQRTTKGPLKDISDLDCRSAFLKSGSVKVCGRRPRARGATVMGPASENLHTSRLMQRGKNALSFDDLVSASEQ